MDSDLMVTQAIGVAKALMVTGGRGAVQGLMELSKCTVLGRKVLPQGPLGG